MMIRRQLMGAHMARSSAFRFRARLLPALLLLLPAILPAQQGTDPTTEAAAPGDPPGRAGRISILTGPTSFQAAGSTDWTGATVNYTVTTGDRLYTDQASRAEVEIGTSAIRMDGKTDVTLTNLTDHLIQLGMAEGTMRLSVYRLDPGDSVEIDTPNGALTVGAPGEYRVDIPKDNASTIVTVDRGSLEASGPGLLTSIRAGQTVEFAGVNQITTLSLGHPAPTAFDQWSADRDHRYAATGCTKYVSGDIPGCADLDQNGRWAVDPTNGPVWYPTVTAADWVPYRYGHWVWIEAWGWTWVEDEPWGYAPFHYGRWASINSRWGWIPGPIVRRPYYAPALVAFVGGSGFSVGLSVGVQAWFPLGPREPYYPWYHYGDRYLRTVNYTNIRNVTDINALVRVRSVDDIRYVNRGVAVTAVPTATFASGRPVYRDIVHVSAAQVARAQIMPHPTAAPMAGAAVGIRGTSHPPVISARPAMVTSAPPRVVRGGAPAPVTAAPAVAQRPNVITRTPPPARGAPAAAPPNGRQAAPPAAGTNAPAGAQVNGQAAARNGPRTLITRATPPAATPPFATREPALQQHAGRPLEPQQMQNLRGGQPAGPQRDAEFPPHAEPPRGQPARGAAPPPAARGGTPTPPARGAPPAQARGGSDPKRGGGKR